MRRRKAPGVWVRCDACGRQRLPVESMTLRTAAADTPVDQVNWHCRACGRLAVTPVRAVEAAALVAAGIRMIVLRPLRTVPDRPTDLPRITSDEVGAWADLLGQPGWLEARVNAGL